MMAEYINREAVEKFIEKGLNNPDKSKAYGYDAIEILAEVHYMDAADVVEVRHAYWTGRLISDDSFAEGYAPWFTEEDKRKYDDMEKHTTHCSNCKGGFDDREVVDWRYCPYCGARMDGGKSTK